ncbi:hypothetical protein [Planococcus koreensis]|uniref:hypothetical protein n=1 Tax=Planococcus koreensis TaxID=112331 RepID=UPI0039FC9E18
MLNKIENILYRYSWSQKTYRKVITKWKLFMNHIKKRISDDHIDVSLMILFFLFLFLYIIIPPLSSAASIELKKSVDNTLGAIAFQGFGDGTVKYIVTTITNSMVFVLSILSAMYVFTHREHKTVSPSVSNVAKKNALMIWVVVSIILLMLAGHTLSANMESLMQLDAYKNQHSLHVTRILFYKLLFWCAALIVVIVLVIEIIRYLFTSMNPNKMLKSAIEEVSFNISTLVKLDREENVSKFVDYRYKKLHHNFESIFQYLKFLGDNNMNRDFEENVLALSNVIDELKQGDEVHNIQSVASFLSEEDGIHFNAIYTSLLRNNLSLIIHLYKNNHFNKGRELTNLYFSNFIEGEDILKEQFIFSLNEFLDSLDTTNERQLKDFLLGLRKLPEINTLIIYKNLIQKLIVKKNIEVITNVVYDFKNHIFEEENGAMDIEKTMANAIGKISNKNVEISAISILLQSLIKSIEISQYGTAGFLVKYLITNFSGADINEANIRLKNRPTSFTRVSDEDDEKNGIMIDHEKEIDLIGINLNTFDYCSKKMSILLYGQQQYAIKEKLWFYEDIEGLDEPIDIETDFKNCDYTSYIVKKVKSTSKKFGLLFFEDREVYKEICEKLKVETES